MALKLVRQPSTDRGTFGTLSLNDILYCYTCERPDNGNQKMGCVPEGEYIVSKFNSPSKGAVLLLKDVPNRDMIEIHAGNTIKDTEGCILVGASFLQDKDGIYGVGSSRITLSQLLRTLPDETSILITQGE